MAKTLTHEQRVVRASFIRESAERNPGRDYMTSIREGVAAYNAHRAGRAVNEATTTRPAPKLSKKQQRRARIIAESVRETLTAAKAPKPAPAAASAPAASKPAASKPLHELTGDQLLAATPAAFSDGRSPFWQPRESASAPAAPVNETASAAVAAAVVAAAAPDVPLHELSVDDLHALTAGAYSAHAAASGFKSPRWQR